MALNIKLSMQHAAIRDEIARGGRREGRRRGGRGGRGEGAGRGWE